MNRQNQGVFDIFPLSEQAINDLESMDLSLTRGVDGAISNSPYYAIDKQTNELIIYNVSLSDKEIIEHLVRSAKINSINPHNSELPSEAYY